MKKIYIDHRSGVEKADHSFNTYREFKCFDRNIKESPGSAYYHQAVVDALISVVSSENKDLAKKLTALISEY